MLAPAETPAKRFAAIQLRQLGPSRGVLLRPGGQAQGEVPQVMRRWLHPQQTGQLYVAASRLADLLASNLSIFTGRTSASWRFRVTARSKAVEAAQHDQALAMVVHRLL